MKNRREVIAGSAAVLAVGAIAARFATANADSLHTRFAAYSPEGARNLDVLARAVRIMTGNDPSHPVSREIRRMGTNARLHPFSWARQEFIHAGKWGQHWNWRFFPWHRLQLAAFESIVRQLTNTPAFALPYWDPRVHRVLPPQFFNPSSPLWVPGRSVSAQTDFESALDRIRGSSPMFELAYMYDAFPRFHGEPFLPGRRTRPGTLDANTHGAVHNIIGGAMRNPETATRDPLFWLHHANIDRIWTTWQYAHRRDPGYPAAFLGEELGNAFVHPAGSLYGWRASDVLNPATLNAGMAYRYDALYELPGAAPPPPPPRGEVWQFLEKRRLTIDCIRQPAGTDARGTVFLLQVPEDFRPEFSESRQRWLSIRARVLADADALQDIAFIRIAAIAPDKTVAWDMIAPFFHFHADEGVQLEIEIDSLPSEMDLLRASGDGTIKVLLSTVNAEGTPIGGEIDAAFSADLTTGGEERVSPAPQQ